MIKAPGIMERMAVIAPSRGSSRASAASTGNFVSGEARARQEDATWHIARMTWRHIRNGLQCYQGLMTQESDGLEWDPLVLATAGVPG
jgi:hypothetical protein